MHDGRFPHISNAQALVTPYENTRAGFVQMALEKSRRATPFVLEARDLAEQLKHIASPTKLLEGGTNIRGALLTAAGVSDKAAEHFDDETKRQALHKFIEEYLVPTGISFREELIYRFLLTRGDSLGGAMRNVVGVLAHRRFINMLAARLCNSDHIFSHRSGQAKTWTRQSRDSVLANPDEIKFISWQKIDKRRVLAFNQTIPAVGNNIDISLLDCSPESFSRTVYADKSSFVALGELKGGIDPAGADEHWKTANSALGRIRAGFARSKHRPALFFVGAAIEQSMAKEIWAQIQKGQLGNAANLTNDQHLSSLCDWLIGL
jgi:hypothetical protein